MTTRLLGRYELLEQLGEGGMGAVWLARLSGAHGFEKLFIVKTVLPALAKDEGFVSRFLHEGRVLTQLTHGNIAQVFDMNEADGQLYLALEYVAGVDLSRLSDNVRAAGEYMPLPLVVLLLTQAAEGLGAAHRKVALDGTPLKVVHRDVSPQNVMVSYEGEVKVIDFGIARSEARSKHTAQASVMGKLGYMAPEQARGEPVDHRADQYALGIVAWELLANAPFVARGTVTEMVAAMALPRIKPLSGLRCDVPHSLEAVVLRALAPEPDARFPDTDAFAEALSAELRALGPPPTRMQLGAYVKARCSQEFTAQHALLTRISTLRPLATPTMPTQQVPTDVARPGPHAQTVASRPSARREASAPSTAELAAAATRSKTPARIVAGVLVVGLLSAALWFTTPHAPAPPRDRTVEPTSPLPTEARDASVSAPTVVTPTPALPQAPPEPPPAVALTLTARFTGTSWILNNRDPFRWTGCVLMAPGQRRARIADLAPGTSVEVSTGALQRDLSVPEGPQLVVRCAQGEGRAR